MIRSVANRYYRMSRTLACRTWKRFRRIPSGRGDNGTLLFTDDQEIGSRDERAGQRALHTRFGHGSTFLFSPVAAAANGTFTASWSSSPRVSRRRMGRARGGGEGGRGEVRQFQKSIHEVVHLSIRGTNESVRFADPAASLGFVRNRGTMATMTQTPPLHLFFFSFSSSSSIIVPCLARGESFDDDLDDLDEDEV